MSLMGFEEHEIHKAQLSWVRAEYSSSRMDERDLRRWLDKLGYHGAILDAEVEFLKDGNHDYDYG